VTMIGAERPDTKAEPDPRAEVILGVDTHLDVHVAVAVDHLGRRLGEASVPTTARGYEKLLCWAQDFGPVRCAGIEGTSSYGALSSPATSRHRESRCWRWSAPSAGSEARAVGSSPTPRTPRAPHGRFWPEKRRACPRAVTASWR
jgi:hypothetical protein